MTAAFISLILSIGGTCMMVKAMIDAAASSGQRPANDVRSFALFVLGLLLVIGAGVVLGRAAA